ncbi:transglycosylase SLT domain-containing protein [Acinetobacter junii]|uniref:transglycosylase SLT domain-containing protein n=1 Tax=Acinetobacter junii TaxID=40215 RepID=UPI000F661BFF|nr:transglycosylase SLT domain-containing protein [Acinetobacter junii]QXR26638.1 transglycosylase SLT domain-containing protein [Acinetobacter junii]
MATTSLGRLTLDLVAQIGQFVGPMNQAERKAKESTDKMNKAFASFKDQMNASLDGTQFGSAIGGITDKFNVLRGGVLSATASLAGMAVGGVVIATGALGQMSIDLAKADAELNKLARRAVTSAENFQVAALAASSFGVDQQKLSDILADTSEKLGEYTATKGGEAAEFFDMLANNSKMSAKEIENFSKKLSTMDTVEAITEITSKLDEMGVTSAEKRFVLESLASDLGDLAPLFADNAILIKEYGEQLKEAGVVRTQESIDKSLILNAQTQALGTQFQGFKNQLAGQMTPVLSNLIQYFVDGAVKSGSFGTVLSAVGTVAKVVGIAIVGVASAVSVVIQSVSGFAKIINHIGVVAANLDAAGSISEKIGVLKTGFSDGKAIWVDTAQGIDKTISSMMLFVKNVQTGTMPTLKGLASSQLNLNTINTATTQSTIVDTKTAEENAKAKEAQAKAIAKSNKELQINALVMSNAKKYRFADLESQYKLPQGLLSAINMQESRGKADALGPMTKYGQAKGGFQFLDGTAKRFGLIGNEVFNTGKSAEAAAKYFSILFEKFGSWEKAISAYHAGEGNVERGTGLGPINREYVKNVLGFMDATLKGVGTTAQDAVSYVEDVFKNQLAIVSKYATEEQSMAAENEEAIKAIKKAFAEDDPSRQKYLDLQKEAYDKDVQNFKNAQLEKFRGLAEDAAYASSDWARTAAEMTGKGNYYSLGQERGTRYAESFAVFETQSDLLNQQEQDPNADFVLIAQQREAIWQAHNDRMAMIERQYESDSLNLKLSTYGGILSASADFFGAMLGNSNDAYKALFFAQKSFALAQAGMNVYKSASDAYANEPGTVWQKMGAAALATLESGKFVALLEAATPVGMAHSGIDNIPNEGTWLLDKGERVLSPRQNTDLTSYLNNQKQGSTSSVQISQQITFADGSAKVDTQGQKDVAQSLDNAMSAWARRESRQGGVLYNLVRK